MVRCIVTKETKDKPRSFFDNIDKWAKDQGASGLAYFTLVKENKILGKGPVGKFFSEESLKELMQNCNADVGDSIFLACGKEKEVEQILSIARDKIAKDLNLIDENKFAFCWIVDYPMFELDEKSKKLFLVTTHFLCPKVKLKI